MTKKKKSLFPLFEKIEFFCKISAEKFERAPKEASFDFDSTFELCIANKRSITTPLRKAANQDTVLD